MAGERAGGGRRGVTPAGRSNDAREPAPSAQLHVDGKRPAVARVAALPRAYRLTDAEWRVLMVLACDSYDGEISAPGLDNLTRWTGLLHGSVAAAIARLCEPTEHRPPLLDRIYQSPGRRRTEYQLLLPRDEAEALALAAIGSDLGQPREPSRALASPRDQPSSEPSSEPSSLTGGLTVQRTLQSTLQPDWTPLHTPLSLQASSLSLPPQPAPAPSTEVAARSDKSGDDDELMHAQEVLDHLTPDDWEEAMLWARNTLPTSAGLRARTIAAARHVAEVAA